MLFFNKVITDLDLKNKSKHACMPVFSWPAHRLSVFLCHRHVSACERRLREVTEVNSWQKLMIKCALVSCSHFDSLFIQAATGNQAQSPRNHMMSSR